MAADTPRFRPFHGDSGDDLGLIAFSAGHPATRSPRRQQMRKLAFGGLALSVLVRSERLESLNRDASLHAIAEVQAGAVIFRSPAISPGSVSRDVESDLADRLEGPGCDDPAGLR